MQAACPTYPFRVTPALEWRLREIIELLKGLRVLVVEDEAIIAMLIEEFLEELGCELVATATRLEAAIEVARTLTIDIALVDLNLAGKVSYPVAEILQARGIPFVFATGYGKPGLPSALQATPVLVKPFQMTQLEDVLRLAKFERALR